MGWKKIGKSVKKAVKKAVKAVVKFVDKVVNEISNALQKVWKQVIVPILEAIMNFLGFKDEEVIVVAANTQPLFDEKTSFLVKDDVFLKNAMRDNNIFETIKDVIISGRHNDFRSFYRYGREKYFLGLPDVSYGAAQSTEGRLEELLDFWKIHCVTYGFSNPYTTVASLPLSYYDIHIVESNTQDSILLEVYKSYAPALEIGHISLDEKVWKLHWDTLTTSIIVVSPSEDGDIANETLNFSVKAIRSNQFYAAPAPVLKAGMVTENIDVTTTEIVETEVEVTRQKLDPETGEPMVDPETNEPIMETVIEIVSEEVTVVTPTPTRVAGFTVSAGVTEDTDEFVFTLNGSALTPTSATELPSTMDGALVKVTGPTVFGSTVHWRLDYDSSLKRWSVVPTTSESRASQKLGEVTLTGSVLNHLAEYVQATFRVNSTAYTPYPDNLDHTFEYRTQTESEGGESFTGNGVSSDPDSIYGASFNEIMPIVLLKNSGTWIDANKGSTGYLTSEKLLTYMKMDMDSLIKGVKKDTDTTEVTTLAIRFGIDALTENQACKRYIFEFFDYLRGLQIVSKADFEASAGTRTTVVTTVGAAGVTSRQETVTIGQAAPKLVFNHYSFEEGSFNCTMSMGYVDRTSGTLPLSGARKKGYVEISHTDEDLTITKHLGGGAYRQLFVRKLGGSYVIRPTQAGGKAELAMMTLAKSDDVNVTQSFVVPIVRGLYYKVPTLQREEVRARSAYLTVFSGTYEKIKWYKTAKFMKTIGIIITVVVAVLTFYLGPGPSMGVAAFFAALTTYAGVQALIINLIVAYAISRIASYAIEKVLIAFGADEWAAIAALIGSAVAAYYGAGALGMQQSWSMAVLQGTQATASAFTKIKSEEFGEMAKDFQDFMKNYDIESKENQDRLKELNIPLQAKMTEYLVESPDSFFGRVEADTTDAFLTEDVLSSIDFEHIFI